MKKQIITLAAVLMIAGLAKADGSAVALGGYCPVAYLAANKALYGDAKFVSVVNGHTYHFIDANAKKLFDADQSKFVNSIQYDAWCATALAQGAKVASDPMLFSLLEGKVYLFSNADAKKAFDAAAPKMIKSADANWKKLSK